MQHDPFVNDNILILFEGQDTPRSTQKREKEQRRPKPAKDASGWRHRFRKDLLEKQGGHCADCYQRKRLQFHKLYKGSDPTKADNYVLLCSDCIRKRKAQPKTKAGQRFRIRRDLVKKLGRKYRNLYMCPGCLKRKKLRLLRVNQDNDPSRESDYLLLCQDCIHKRIQERKKTRLWTRKPGKKNGISKTAMLASIRPLVFERDGKACVWCGAKEKLGLGPLIPPSRGGKLCFDNTVVTCQRCRGSKGSRLPLEYIWSEITLDYWLHEQLDDGVTVKNPGATASLNVHLIGEIAEFCARVTADDRVPPKHRKKAEFIHIRLSESDEDRRRERKAERADMGSWIK